MTDSPSAADIRDARLSAGLTQTQAAALIGYSLRAWQNWESGKVKIRPLIWQAWLSRLGKSSSG